MYSPAIDANREPSAKKTEVACWPRSGPYTAWPMSSAFDQSRHERRLRLKLLDPEAPREKAALLPVRPWLVSPLFGRHRPNSRRAVRKSVRSLISEGRQDASSDRRCGNGRVDDGIGAAAVRRLRIGRYLRANEGAQHRRRRAEHSAQRGADLSLARRRPRWRGSQRSRWGD